MSCNRKKPLYIATNLIDFNAKTSTDRVKEGQCLMYVFKIFLNFNYYSAKVNIIALTRRVYYKMFFLKLYSYIYIIYLAIKFICCNINL